MYSNRIKQSLSNQTLASYISFQLNNFFPDNQLTSSEHLFEAIQKAEGRVYHCFSNIEKKLTKKIEEYKKQRSSMEIQRPLTICRLWFC